MYRLETGHRPSPNIYTLRNEYHKQIVDHTTLDSQTDRWGISDTYILYVVNVKKAIENKAEWVR